MAEPANANFVLRRRARGSEPPTPIRSWRPRLVGIIVVVALAIAAITTPLVWRRLTRVYTLSARVQAAVVSLSPVVDARLLELHVDVGEHVKQGQVLARLDDTELRAALEAAEATRAIKQSEHAQAEARLALVGAAVESDIEQARAAAQIVATHIESARAAVKARAARLIDEIRASEAQHAEAVARSEQLKRGPREEDILAAKARLEAAAAMQSLYELELAQSRKLATEGIDSQHLLEVRRTRVVTQEKAVTGAQLELQSLQAGATAEELEVAHQAVAIREAQLALARLGSNDVHALTAQLAVREAERQESEARFKQAEAQRRAVDVAREEMHAAAAELQRAEAEARGRQAALTDRDFVSPIDGLVVRTFARVGEVCRKGVPCILVADDNRPRWVEGFVREADAMHVTVGQRAWVRAPANLGDYVEAVVEQVGLHTQSLDDGDGEGATTGARYMQPERVWVRLRPLQPLNGKPVTGTSARAVIRVR